MAAYLYLLEIEGRNTLKLGCSVSPRSRARALAAETRAPVRVLAVVPGTVADEKALHARFAGWRKPGPHTVGHVKENHGGPRPREWYFPAPEILRWAASLPEGHHGRGPAFTARKGKSRGYQPPARPVIGRGGGVPVSRAQALSVFVVGDKRRPPTEEGVRAAVALARAVALADERLGEGR